MKRFRLALITRRFWPLVGGAERVMANLATEFRRSGESVELVTARWERSWPSEIVHQEVAVHRLPHPKARAWGTLRYMQALGRWIRQHRRTIDGMLVSMLKHDAHVAVHVGRRLRIPVIVRAEGGGVSGDCRWQEEARFGLRMREMTRSADAWVAPSRTVYEELIQAGYPAERGTVVPNGVSIPPPRTPRRRDRARRALAETHAVFNVGSREPLVVYTGRLTAAKGLFDLIQAWVQVVKRWPHAKLWLVGDGDDAPKIWQWIRSRELTHTIILPGSFDDTTEVLYAADAFVLPSYEEGLSLALLEAMAAGVPVVASDIPGNRQLVDSHELGWLVPPRDPQLLATAIAQVLANPQAAQDCASTARRLIEQEYSLETMAQRHLDIIHHAIASRPN